MAYKRFYLTGSVSLLAILALIAPFIDYYYNYGDVQCGEECWTTFCMKNGNKDLYFYNSAELPLTFSPEDQVTDVKFFKKDGRIKLGDHPGYRLIDFVTPYSEGVKYVFKIPAYAATCYGIEVHKTQWADVKWSFGELDPMMYGIDKYEPDVANRKVRVNEEKDITYEPDYELSCKVGAIDTTNMTIICAEDTEKSCDGARCNKFIINGTELLMYRKKATSNNYEKFCQWIDDGNGLLVEGRCPT